MMGIASICFSQWFLDHQAFEFYQFQPVGTFFCQFILLPNEIYDPRRTLGALGDFQHEMRTLD